MQNTVRQVLNHLQHKVHPFMQSLIQGAREKKPLLKWKETALLFQALKTATMAGQTIICSLNYT